MPPERAPRVKVARLGTDRQARVVRILVLVIGGLCLALILSSAVVAFLR